MVLNGTARHKFNHQLTFPVNILSVLSRSSFGTSLSTLCHWKLKTGQGAEIRLMLFIYFFFHFELNRMISTRKWMLIVLVCVCVFFYRYFDKSEKKYWCVDTEGDQWTCWTFDRSSFVQYKSKRMCFFLINNSSSSSLIVPSKNCTEIGLLISIAHSTIHPVNYTVIVTSSYFCKMKFSIQEESHEQELNPKWFKH